MKAQMQKRQTERMSALRAKEKRPCGVECKIRKESDKGDRRREVYQN